jgi:hypothetical protein
MRRVPILSARTRSAFCSNTPNFKLNNWKRTEPWGVDSTNFLKAGAAEIQTETLPLGPLAT